MSNTVLFLYRSIFFLGHCGTHLNRFLTKCANLKTNVAMAYFWLVIVQAASR